MCLPLNEGEGLCHSRAQGVPINGSRRMDELKSAPSVNKFVNNELVQTPSVTMCRTTLSKQLRNSLLLSSILMHIVSKWTHAIAVCDLIAHSMSNYAHFGD